MTTGIFERPLDLTSQFGFCGLPLRLDSYRGCAFQCSYCFARQRGGNVPAAAIVPADPNTLERIFRRTEGLRHHDQTMLGQFLRRRVPIHFGGMSDPFQPAETRYRISAAMLESLAARRYPTVISTRGLLVAENRYVALLKDIKHVVVQLSLTTTDDRVNRELEPLSPPSSELLDVMRRLTENHITVTCRWQPYIPDLVEGPEDFIPVVARAGARHVGMEHLKIPVESGHPMWQSLTQKMTHNIHQIYRGRGAVRDGREFVLPSQDKLKRVMRARRTAQAHGITFGAADNDLQYLSHTPCCCSGVDQFVGFQNWFKHQIAHALWRSRTRAISYNSVAREWAPSGSIDRFLNSKSRLAARGHKRSDIKEHLRYRWNNSAVPGSPATFYGVLATERFSRCGYRIYEWDRSKTDHLWRALAIN